MTMPGVKSNSLRTKRSAKVALTTMVAISGGALLSACGEEPVAPSANAGAKDQQTEVQVFENVFACAKITGKTRDECETMREEAIAEAKAEAPRFQALQDCEAQFGEGKCVENGFGEMQGEGEEQQQSRSGRGHFSPFVVAWFSRSGNRNAPLFNNKAGGYQSANGARLSFGGKPGKYLASNRAFERTKTVPKVKPASRMAKAGGFGGRNGAWNLADRGGGSSKSSRTASGGKTSSSSRSRGG